VTHISAIFLLVPIGIINEEDIQVLNIMKNLLGDGFRKNTMLVFTHAEQHQLATLTDRIKEFLSSEISLPFLDFCQGGIHFSGALSGELVAEHGQEYEAKVKHKVLCLRQNLFETIMAQNNVKVNFAEKIEHLSNHNTVVEKEEIPIREKPKPMKTETPSKRQAETTKK